eukprot:COSAG05_NODE_15462_length_369_cov_0.614815_1_plen_73_part_10
MRATCYVVKGKKTLVAIASWAPHNTSVTFSDINWTTLGLVPGAVTTVEAQPISGFQDHKTWSIKDPIEVSPGK